MSYNDKLGIEGEKIAQSYLENKGYKLLNNREFAKHGWTKRSKQPIAYFAYRKIGSEQGGFSKWCIQRGGGFSELSSKIFAAAWRRKTN